MSPIDKTSLAYILTGSMAEKNIRKFELLNGNASEAGHDKLIELIDSGFRELRENFLDIKTEVNSIHTTHVKIEEEIKIIKTDNQHLKEKVDKINDAIYEPDTGIYRRINENIFSYKIESEKLNDVEEKIGKLETAIIPIGHIEQNLKKIAGDNLEELYSIIKTKKTLNGILWIIITTAVTVIVTVILKYFSVGGAS